MLSDHKHSHQVQGFDGMVSRGAQVMEGYVFLGTVKTLGAEASACFGAVASAGAVAAVQQALPPRPGAAPPASMHDAVRLLQSDMLRSALPRVPPPPNLHAHVHITPRLLLHKPLTQLGTFDPTGFRAADWTLAVLQLGEPQPLPDARPSSRTGLHWPISART